VEWHWQRIDFFVQPDAGKCMEQIVTCPNLVEHAPCIEEATREEREKQSKAAGASDSPDQLDSLTGRSHGLWGAKSGQQWAGWATGLLLLVDV
jgi:hypothetical protein